MPISETVYKVFISSPSDLMEERQNLKTAIEKLDIPEGRLQAVLWEEDLPSYTTDDVQGEIDGLLSECDILCGVFKSRFGSPTKRNESGTVEEIELQISQKKPVILYFLNATLQSNVDISEDFAEMQKILDFKKKYKGKGIYRQCADIQEITSRWLKKDVEKNIKLIPAETNPHTEVEDEKVDASPALSVHSDDIQDKPWYMDRIAALINENLQRKRLTFKYREDLTFHENLLLCPSGPFMTSTVQSIMDSARTEAFNSKYGQYDYRQDIRAKFPNWGVTIAQIIKEAFPKKKKLKILDVGGNCGLELEEIFGSPLPDTNEYTIVELSDEAILRGSKMYPKVQFSQAAMESAYLQPTESFDVCMCLRAIQSRGVYRNAALIQMSKHLRPGGIIIISIPNGYIGPNKEIVEGLYDHRTKTFLKDRPISLARKICVKLGDYNFVHIQVQTVKTEILIYAEKGEVIEDA